MLLQAMRHEKPLFGVETLLAIHIMWNNCTCSPLEDAFARGLGAGLGSGTSSSWE